MDDTTSDWHLSGNDAIDPINHFLGTLGSQPLVVRTNHWANPSASERMRVSATGNVGVGTDDPRQGRLVIEDSAVPLALKETGQGPASGGLWRLALDGGVLRLDVNTAAAADFSSFSSRLAIKPDGSVGVGVANPAARLEVSGGDIRLEAGRTFYSPGRLHVHGEELLYVLNKGGMVVGKEWGGNGNLSVQGNLEVLSASNPIRLSSAWSGFPDPVTNRAEISNDTATYKTLMIVGNKSAGMGRRVSVWDRLEVNGSLFLNGVNIRQTLIQSGEASPGELRSPTGQMIDKRVWVSFPVHYAEPPRVVLMLKACDVNRNFNQRLDMWTSNVTTYGFYANFRTWADTHFYLIAANWIAHGWQ